MKYINWVKKNGFAIILAVFFIVLLLLLSTLFNSLKKDHSLDLVKLELRMKEDARKDEIKQREALFIIVEQYNEQIKTLIQRDSIVKEYVVNVDGKLNNLSKKQNEKVKIINNYNSPELLEYFSNISDQPDNEY